MRAVIDDRVIENISSVKDAETKKSLAALAESFSNSVVSQKVPQFDLVTYEGATSDGIIAPTILTFWSMLKERFTGTGDNLIHLPSGDSKRLSTDEIMFIKAVALSSMSYSEEVMSAVTHAVKSMIRSVSTFDKLTPIDYSFNSLIERMVIDEINNIMSEKLGVTVEEKPKKKKPTPKKIDKAKIQKVKASEAKEAAKRKEAEERYHKLNQECNELIKRRSELDVMIKNINNQMERLKEEFGDNVATAFMHSIE